VKEIKEKSDRIAELDKELREIYDRMKLLTERKETLSRLRERAVFQLQDMIDEASENEQA
jgi:small-conductance mechanosensitive channel